MSQKSKTFQQMNQRLNGPAPATQSLSHLTSNETQISSQLVGFVVNGFHPQLTSLKENKEQIAQKKPCTESMTMNNKISQIVENCREEEEKGVKKQKEELSLAMQSGMEPDWDSDVDNEDYESDVSMQDSDIISEITRSHMSLNDAFGDVFQHSAVPQLIASPGGRIVTWNNQFVTMCGFTPSSAPSSFTVFDLVEPTMMTQLFQVFLYALTDKDIINDGDTSGHEEMEYKSVTIPCRNFSTLNIPFHITLTLMYDVDPNKRCFHCIITSTSSNQSSLQEPLGKMRTVNQTTIMELL